MSPRRIGGQFKSSGYVWRELANADTGKTVDRLSCIKFRLYRIENPVLKVFFDNQQWKGVCLPDIDNNLLGALHKNNQAMIKQKNRISVGER